jgi:hypothetical protein
LACGVVAGSVAGAAAIVTSEVERRLFGHAQRETVAGVFIGVGCAIFGFADWLGVLAAPYEKPPDVLSLHADEHEPSRRIQPPNSSASNREP